MKPAASRASITSPIACGVMNDRRASCAFESPSRRRPSTLNVVYCNVVSP